MSSLNKLSTKAASASASARRNWQAITSSRTARKWTVGVLLALVAFGLLGFFAAPPLIRSVGQTQLSKQLGRPVHIGRIALNPYTLNFEADRVRIAEPDGKTDFIAVERLIVRPSWLSLFRGAPLVRQLKIDSPHFHIVRTAPQRFNFSDLVDKFSKPSAPGGKPTLFSVSNIEIENGSVDFDDRVLDARHQIDQIAIGVPFIATLPADTDIFVQPRLHARVDGSALNVEGKTKPFATSRESDIAVRLDRLDLPKLLSYAPTRLPLDMKSGQLSTDLQVRFAVGNTGPTVRVTGTADLYDVATQSHDGQPVASAARLSVAAASVEPLSNRYELTSVTLDKPTVSLARNPDGTLDVMSMLGGGGGGAAGAAPSAGAGPANAASAGAASASAAASGTAAPAAPAAPASPLDLSVKKLSIADGTVHFKDRVPAHAVDVPLTQINVQLTGFSLRSPTDAQLAFETRIARDARLAVEGTVSTGAKRANLKVGLDRLALAPWQPYVDSVLAARITQGALAAHLPVTADWSAEPLALKIGAGDVTLDGVKLAARGGEQADAKSAPIGVAHASAKIAGIDLTAKTAVLSEVSATGLDLAATRRKDGTIDLSSLVAGGAQARPAPPANARERPKASGPAKGGRQAGEGAWRYRIDHVAVSQSNVTFVDQSAPRPVSVALGGLQIDVRDLTDDLSKPWRVKTAATVNGKGTFDIGGTATLQPLTLALAIDGRRLDAAALEPYFGNLLNVRIASALANAKGDLRYTQGKAGPVVRYDGDASLVEVRMLDNATQELFAGWRTLAATGIKAAYDTRATDVVAQRVTLDTFYGRVFLDAQGRLNLKDVTAKGDGHKGTSVTQADRASPASAASAAGGGAASKVRGGAAKAAAASAASTAASAAGQVTGASAASGAAATTAAASSPLAGRAEVIVGGASQPAVQTNAASDAGASAAARAGQPASGATAGSQAVVANVHPGGVNLRFGELIFKNGRVTYTDNFVKPNFTANLVKIVGRVGAFGTQSTQPAPVDVKANLAGSGPVSIAGNVNPLVEKPSLDVTATAHGVELTNLTPYSAKYAGYPITKGKLNVDLHYTLNNDQLTANNHLFVDQLTFGDHVDSPEATKLPVRLAIALLKNSRGEIDVNVPVSGSLSNPEFSIGGLIWRAILNLLAKAVTAPFSLLANAFGGANAEELGYVEFAPGSAKITPDQEKKLDTIAKALNQKPQVKLDVIGRVDPAADEPALRLAYVDRLVRREKIRDTAGNGASVDPSSIEVSKDEYEKYLRRVYKAADFKKERNFIGLTKSLPPEQMRELLAEHAPVDQQSLRALAQERAAAVQQWFDGKVEAARIYTVAPKLDASGIKDKGATTRVDFSLR